MKKLMIVLLSMALLIPSVMAHAGSHGSAYVPYFSHYFADGNTNASASITVTNISSEEITCTVRVYDQEGNDKSTYALAWVKGGAYGTYNVPNLSTSPTFTIPANGTRMISYILSSQYVLRGHAIVEWESTSDNIGQALLGAYLSTHKTNGVYAHSIYPINEGRPF